VCTEIIDTFQQAQIPIEEEREVSIMAFAMDDKEIRLEIVSTQEIGEKRNRTQLKILNEAQKLDIQDLVLDYIESVLSITVEDLSDLFQT
jgi:hypothetical protein